MQAPLQSVRVSGETIGYCVPHKERGIEQKKVKLLEGQSVFLNTSLKTE